MPRVTPIYSNFTGGEVSDRIIGRTDIDRYYQSCRVLENFLIMTQGGGERRAGSTFLVETKEDDERVRLIGYITEDGSYVLEIGEGYIRVIFAPTHTQILSGTPYEVGGSTPPWLWAELNEVQVVQTHDRMYFTHPNHPPQKLVYVDSTNWTLSAPSFTGTTFSATGDYPRACTFFEQRLYFGGTDNNPNSVWGSKVGDYEDFTIGVNDDDAFEFPLASDRYEVVQWLASKGDVVVGTSAGEYILSGEGAPITPTNVLVKRQSTYGSPLLQATVVNENIFFVQKSKKKVRQYVFQRELDAYISPDLTLLADHVTADGIWQTALQNNPDTIFWIVTEDGELAGLTYDRSANILGWHRHTTQGLYESICVVPTDTEEDEVWVTVKRDPSAKRYIEYFEPRRLPTDQADLKFVDSGVHGTGEAVTAMTSASNANPCEVTQPVSDQFTNDMIVKVTGCTVFTELNGKYFIVKNQVTTTFDLYHLDGTTAVDTSSHGSAETNMSVEQYYSTIDGLDHLEGETVAVMIDGSAHPDRTVASGEITLEDERYAHTYHVGLWYRSILLPMRFEAGAMEGTAQGRKKKVINATLRFFQTLGGKIGEDLDNLEELRFREGDALMDTAVPIYTGDKKEVIYSSFDTSGNLYIVQDQPFPMGLLSIIPKIITNE